MTTVALAPIGEQDLPDVADFLVRNLDPGASADTWARALLAPWQRVAPNRGFMLVEDGHIVGAYLAFYSTRVVSGQTLGICNLGPWCVLDTHRSQGLRLLRALLRQPAYHFTDLSPSGAVVPLNERLGFRHLDTATSLMPNLPWPGLRGRVQITEDPVHIAASLSGDELQLFRDHEGLSAARHLLVRRGGEHCHVVFRRDTRKGLPLFASILHVSNPALFRSCARQVGSHLLVRHRLPVMLAERRVVGGRLHPALRLSAHRPKMVRSAVLEDRDVDYLYSELTCLPW